MTLTRPTAFMTACYDRLVRGRIHKSNIRSLGMIVIPGHKIAWNVEELDLRLSGDTTPKVGLGLAL